MPIQQPDITLQRVYERMRQLELDARQLQEDLLAINASQIVAGTLADARLSSNVPLLNAANVFSANQRINAGLGINIAPGALGTLSLSAGIFERSRATAIGEWIDVPHDSGNFTASGSMTWTVEAADQQSFAYMLIGKTVIVRFTLNGTSVGGTVSSELRVTIPGGFTAKTGGGNPTIFAIRSFDNGTETVGFCGTVSGATYIRCWRGGFSSWALSTNNTTVQGMAMFEVD